MMSDGLLLKTHQSQLNDPKVFCILLFNVFFIY